MQPVATSATASKHDEIAQINKLGVKNKAQSKYTSKNASSNLRHFGVLERDVSLKGMTSEVKNFAIIPFPGRLLSPWS